MPKNLHASAIAPQPFFKQPEMSALRAKTARRVAEKAFVLAVYGFGVDYFIITYQYLVSRFHQQKRGRYAFLGDFYVLRRVARFAVGEQNGVSQIR